MNIIFAYILSAVAAYLLGGINSGIIITKIVAHKDIRQLGSGNAGSTNVLRVLGVKPALITLIFDFFKAVAAVALAMLWFKLLCPDILNTYGLCIAALFSVMGHIFPVYFGFKGGKGVITLAGGFMLIHPVLVCIVLGIFVILVAISKYVSLGSIISALTYLVLVAVVALIGNVFTLETGIELILSSITVFLIIFKHKANIKRLLNGTESKISFKKKPIVNSDNKEVK